MFKMSFRLILLIFACNLTISNANAQHFYRIRADFSVKQKDISGKQMLRLGTVFYDLNNKTIVLKNSFPTNEVVAQQDSFSYILENGKLVNKFQSIVPVYFSIFHLSLSNKLENFGLDRMGYTMQEIKKEKGLVMSSWIPQDRLKKYVGKVLVSTKNKQLYAIVFLNPKGELIAKNFYRKYVNINGFVFPKEIVRIQYIGKKESYELTTYKNIILNEFNANEEFYSIGNLR